MFVALPRLAGPLRDPLPALRLSPLARRGLRTRGRGRGQRLGPPRRRGGSAGTIRYYTILYYTILYHKHGSRSRSLLRLVSAALDTSPSAIDTCLECVVSEARSPARAEDARSEEAGPRGRAKTLREVAEGRPEGDRKSRDTLLPEFGNRPYQADIGSRLHRNK